jgi:hypothetical protein
LETFVDAGKAAEIDVGISANIERERCQKFILLTAVPARPPRCGRRSVRSPPIRSCVHSFAR